MSGQAMGAPSVWPFDIGIVGTGIVGTHQLTREAEEVIRRSKHTFVIASGFGITEHIETLCPQVTDLSRFYEPGMNRLPTYHRMAAEVLSAAVAEGPICLATYGHPWVYCYPTTLITRAAALLDLHVEVFPGVSAFDTLLVDLGTDIANGGIQMYEATDLLLRQRPVQTDVTCVIWQPTVVGDPTCPDGPYAARQFEPLQEHLLRFYPRDHRVKLVTSKNHPLLRSTVVPLELGELAAALEGMPGIGTLYVPALTERPVLDSELLDLMVSRGTPAEAVPVAPMG
ncbi:SAM-dependent methyltransferase [Streptomyces rubellomurinus]|uniref:SAM-dependent methyltransferase n=1 Tax=Streptomyces sp. Y1 TaxID=3238634 RepID=A0AB39TCR8_9ACTN|nr:SAM-dependent methyltransferase [Streptomyces rubellomurinus]